jgi:hypothetical protein
MAGTALKLGWTNPLTGAFGAHPSLGAILDLNDGVTFALAPDGLTLEAPARTLVTAGNIRTAGERATRGIYRHNRRLLARVTLGPMASYSDLIANVRALVAWLSAPPALPVALQYQPTGASAPVYLDVVGAAHDIPADEADWLRLQLEEIEVVFLVRPGLRGDRVTLSNLAANPGFEAPSGPGVVVFADTFATANAYRLVGGTAPSVSANVMTIPNGTTLTFGSSAWGALNTWQVRFQHTNGAMQAYFFLHRIDAANDLHAFVSGTSFTLNQVIAGSNHQLAAASPTLTVGSWYWLTCTQFPTVAGDPAYVQATLNADAGGTVGTQLASISGPTYDAATALSGLAGWYASGAALAVGGNYAGVQTVSLFGPGGWLCVSGEFSATGVAAGGWERNAANTYAGGPVTSFGAARLDLAPAGSADSVWTNYAGGSLAGAAAIPVSAPGATLGWSLACRQSGLSASATMEVYFNEYDVTGTYLRNGGFTSAGKPSTWATLGGAYTTGANCAYVGLVLHVADATAGSAGATVWWDNAQVWNVTTTGQTSMPYCELRFPQSPAQLVVSGLSGDLPAAAYLAFGTYLSSLAPGGLLTFALGRRALISASAQLVGLSNGFYGTAFSPQATAVLDATSYGGYYAQAQVTSAGWNPRAFSPRPSDAQGTYHLFERHLSKQTTGNLPNVQVRVVAQQLSDPWYGNPNGTDQLGAYTGAWSAPLASSNAWTVVDAGQAPMPPLGAGALTDLTQSYATPRPQWSDATVGGAIAQAGWQMLLPVDGSLLVGVVNNPSNAPFSVTSQWLWGYFDGLGVAYGSPAAWTYSLEATPLPNPAHAGGGPGTQATGAININSGADPHLTLDPTQQLAGNGGVNQLAAYIADGSGTVLPFHAELQYSPLYLWPR